MVLDFVMVMPMAMGSLLLGSVLVVLVLVLSVRLDGGIMYDKDCGHDCFC